MIPSLWLHALMPKLDNGLGKRKDGDLNFLSLFANCTSMEVLSFAQNQFGGVLPSSITNLSTQLHIFAMSQNMIWGGIPFGSGTLIKDWLISVFKIGLLCSTTSPNERMPTNVVVNEMNAIRGTYLKLKKGNKRRMN
ncbi:putative lrr receptor-like serine/threonine-protein kinase [Quercus suber]|uniref:Lrr receptor-like serine/threonine-protein kinase n=1 Tax=Quercus suber TaxID=58331 RepID=A0AAW0LAJ0_QUESU